MNIVEITNLSYAYPKNPKLVLNNINLTIREGERVGLIGATGAGKTTLCLAINGVVPNFFLGDFYGSVKICGNDTVDCPLAKLAGYISCVFQDPETQIITSSVEDEIAFALENMSVPPDEIKNRIEESLAFVGLLEYRKKHPHKLSGGQKQRLAIACAIATHPKLVILDEPTSQIDPIGAKEVYETITRLNREFGTAILLVDHNMEHIATHVDRIYVLDDSGAISMEGPPQQVFSSYGQLNKNHLRAPQVTELFERDPILQEKYTGNYPITLSDAENKFEAVYQKTDMVATIEEKRSYIHKELSTLIKAENVEYVYGDGTKALQGISLEVHRGDFIALIGQNGAGKSTFVKQLLNLIRPSKGEITILGKSSTEYSIGELAKRIGFVFQNPDVQLFSDTVYDEIAFGLKANGYAEDVIKRRVDELLELLDLGDYCDTHPFSLSKGDRARVAIAAALALDPDVVVLDEPTTGQDYSGSLAIMDLAKKLNEKGKTIIVITHHLHLLPDYVNRIVVMGKGKILMDDTPESVFQELDILRATALEPPQIAVFAQGLVAKGWSSLSQVMSITSFLRQLELVNGRREAK